MLRRNLHPDDGTSRDDYNRKTFSENITPFTNDEVSKRKLFVGNLAQRTNSKDLTALFSAYGKVEHCHLYVSGRNNCALVTFTNAEDVLKAVKDGPIKKFHLHHRDLSVMPANSLDEPDNVQTQTNKAKCTKTLTQFDLNGGSKIHSLNDDCLIHIFSFLPIADRVRSERVCRRWRLISHASLSSFKKLDLSLSTWGVPFRSDSTPYSPNNRDMKTPILRNVLLRAGEFLYHLDLSDPAAAKLSKCTMGIIASFCPNLQEIDVTGFKVSPAGIRAFAKNFTNIIKFSLGQCTGTCDTELSTLFTQNKNLRYLKLKRNSSIGECLLNLHSDSMQEIYLEQCIKISTCHLCKAIKKFPNLHTLSLKCSVSFDDQDLMEAISSRINSLKILHLTNYSSRRNENHMLLITALTNLETLIVSGNSCVNDPFLLAVGTKCKQLKKLDLEGCSKVSDNGLLHITSLPKLECLTVNYLGNITDSAFTDMPKLKILECRGCRRIGNTGLISIIEESHDLELMDLSGCDNVDNHFIEAAIKATANRTNGIVCTIYVGGTFVRVTKTDKVSPLLKVIQKDLSNHNLKYRRDSSNSSSDDDEVDLSYGWYF